MNMTRTGGDTRPCPPAEADDDNPHTWRLTPSMTALTMAEDPTTAVLERVRNLAYSAIDLDICTVTHLARARRWGQVNAPSRPAATGPPREPKVDIPDWLPQLAARNTACFDTGVRPALRSENIHIDSWTDLSARERERLRGYFLQDVLPLLVPLAVDQTHPFPLISGQSLNLAVVVCDPDGGPGTFARVKVPENVARFVALDASDRGLSRFLPLEDLITAHLGQVFRGMRVVERHVFRVHREPERSPTSRDVEGSRRTARRGPRHPAAASSVYLETSASISDWVLHLLARQLGADLSAAHRVPGLLDLSSLAQIYRDVDRPDLKQPSGR